MTRARITPALIGLGITLACFGLGYLLDVLLNWTWLTGTSILLTLVIMSIGALAVMGSDHPPAWGGGFWSIYTEMMGREVAGGGLSDMTRPRGGVQTSLLSVAVVPALALLLLLVFALR